MAVFFLPGQHPAVLDPRRGGQHGNLGTGNSGHASLFLGCHKGERTQISAQPWRAGREVAPHLASLSSMGMEAKVKSELAMASGGPLDKKILEPSGPRVQDPSRYLIAPRRCLLANGAEDPIPGHPRATSVSSVKDNRRLFDFPASPRIGCAYLPAPELLGRGGTGLPFSA